MESVFVERGVPVADNYIDGHLKVRMYVLSGAHLLLVHVLLVL